MIGLTGLGVVQTCNQIKEANASDNKLAMEQKIIDNKYAVSLSPEEKGNAVRDLMQQTAGLAKKSEGSEFEAYANALGAIADFSDINNVSDKYKVDIARSLRGYLKSVAIDDDKKDLIKTINEIATQKDVKNISKGNTEYKTHTEVNTKASGGQKPFNLFIDKIKDITR